MTQKDAVKILESNVRALNAGEKWLRRSFRICKEIGIKEDYTPEDFDALEILTSRYARLTDMLIHKAFRSIDHVEFIEDAGTPLDVLNRAEKRELIESVDQMRTLRDLRNKISHEYFQEEIQALFGDVFKKVPVLFRIIRSTKQYVTRYIKK